MIKQVPNTLLPSLILILCWYYHECVWTENILFHLDVSHFLFSSENSRNKLLPPKRRNINIIINNNNQILPFSPCFLQFQSEGRKYLGGCGGIFFTDLSSIMCIHRLCSIFGRARDVNEKYQGPMAQNKYMAGTANVNNFCQWQLIG